MIATYRVLLTHLAAISFVSASGAVASERLRELEVSMQPEQILIPLDSSACSIDSIAFSNPAFGALLHDLGLTNARWAHPQAVMRLGIWGQPGPRGIEKPNFDNEFVFEFATCTGRDEAFECLSQQPSVAWLRKRDTVSILRSPNDPQYSLQWGLLVGPLGSTNAADVWDITVGDPNMLIGIVDDVADATHVDFQTGTGSRIIADEGTQWSSHGTSVAGIIAATTNNGEGLAGVNWTSRVFVKAHDGDLDRAADRTIELVDLGASVINHSYGEDSYQDRLSKAVAYGYNNDVVSVASMDEYRAEADPEDSPSFHPAVIAVGAIRSDGGRAVYSSVGHMIDLTAPGGQPSEFTEAGKIRVLVRGAQKYDWAVGTSFAAPYVTGVVSLLRSRYPALSADDVYQVLTRSALDQLPVGWDNQYGFGIVRADAAFQLLAHPNSMSGGQTSSLTVHSVSERVNRVLRIPGLVSYVYSCKIYEMRCNVTFPKRYFDTVGVWARGSFSRGLSNDNPNYGLHYSEFVPGTVTEEGWPGPK